MAPIHGFVDFLGSVGSAPAPTAAATAGVSTTQVGFQRGQVSLVDTAEPQGRTWARVPSSLQQGEPAFDSLLAAPKAAHAKGSRAAGGAAVLGEV